jgi:protein-S-isoprenylcysteine O-methyltransferase Ste14
MEVARYWVGVLMVSFGPAAILFWFSIHPFIAFWRRVGAKTTLVIHLAGVIAVAGMLIAYRDVLMRGDLGTSYVFTGLAVVLLIVSGVMRYYQNQVLPNTTLLGIPELDPAGHESRLVVEGLYARIRHPRYVQLGVGFLAYALFANFVTCYVAVGLALVGVRVVVAFEERELVARFGDDYRRYMQTTPRFVPRLGAGIS